MKISEIQGFLTKAAGVVGDAPVILKALEADAETELKAIEVTFSALEQGVESTVTLVHGPVVTPAPATASTSDDSTP